MIVSLVATLLLRHADWKEATIPLRLAEIGAKTDDWMPVIKAIGKARIVGAGEATHGSHEIFQLKSRLFRALAEQRGFSVLLLEASYPLCEAIDAYITSGQGDPVTAVKNQGFWTWSNQEMLDLVKWMRAYNQDSSHKIKLRIVGVDMQGWVPAFEAIQHTFKEIGIAGPMIDDPIWFPTVRYEKGIEGAIETLTKNVEEGLPKVERKFGTGGVARIRRLVRIIVQAHALEDRNLLLDDFIDVRSEAIQALPKVKESLPAVLEDAKQVTGDGRYALDVLCSSMEKVIDPKFDIPRLIRGTEEIKAFAKGRAGREGVYGEVIAVLTFLAQAPKVDNAMHHSPRDVFLAENARWAIDTLIPNAKGMLWAHNYHVMRPMPSMPETAGGELSRELGAGYFALGSSFGSGAFLAYNENKLLTFDVTADRGGSLDRHLSQVKKDAFFIPMNFPWTKTDMTTRNVGSAYIPERAETYIGAIRPATSYDGLVFINRIGAAKPLP